MKQVKAVLVVLAIALATHLDWHAARPTVHHLSLGLPFHWLLAVPVFAFAAWYVHQAWVASRAAAGLIVVGTGWFLGAVVEPAWEYWIERAPFDWAFGSARTIGALLFLATGVIAYGLTLLLFNRRASSSPRSPHA